MLCQLSYTCLNLVPQGRVELPESRSLGERVCQIRHRGCISVVSSRDRDQATHALSLHQVINPGTSHQAAHCACRGGCAKAHPKYGGAPSSVAPPSHCRLRAFGIALLPAAQFLKNLATGTIAR